MVITSLFGHDAARSDGLVVFVDHSRQPFGDGVDLRRKLFDDPYLCPELVFISPSDRGVKAFVPYDLNRIADVKLNAAENIYWLMKYVQLTYVNHEEANTKHKGVDYSGKDLVRACFLSHDADALIRE